MIIKRHRGKYGIWDRSCDVFTLIIGISTPAIGRTLM